MNCKQARTLFSSRVDQELNASECMQLDRHLRMCDECAARWASFETTVRMVRTLPPVAPAPSFVGQVLDRVRAYEAADRDAELELPRRGLLDAARGFLRGWDWDRLFLPARWSGAVAFGALVGFVLVWTGVVPHAPFSPQGAAVVAQATPGATASNPAIALQGSARRPFADLAADLALQRNADRADSSSRRSLDSDGVPPVYRPGEDLESGQRVNLNGTSGQPRIIF